MLPAYLASIFLMLVVAVTSVTSNSKASLTELAQTQSKDSVDSVTKAIEDYYLTNQEFPSSIEQLAEVPGYGEVQEYASISRLARDGNVGYSSVYLKPWTNSRIDVSSPLSPGYRDILVGASTRGNSVPSTYVTEAEAGTVTTDGCTLSATFSEDSPAWCQDRKNVVWKILSERELFTKVHPKMVQHHEAASSVLIARYLNVVKGSVTTDAGALPGSINVTTTVASFIDTASNVNNNLYKSLFPLSTPGTSASTCKGVFRAFLGVVSSVQYASPITCENLYNYYGKPLKYKKVSLNEFELISDSVYLRANGSPKVITTSVKFLTTSPRTYTIDTTES